MLKTVLIFTLLLSFQFSLQAQHLMENCGTMEYLQQMKNADPTLEKRMADYETLTQKYISSNKSFVRRSEVITIPVVVHIIYSADSQNISDKRITDQIAISNRDFAGLNPHSMWAFSSSMKANVGIQFCLAKRTPDGKPTSGINRVKTTRDTFAQDDMVKYTSSGGVDAWDPTKYLNIWVCNYKRSDGLGYKFSAFAQYPGSGVNKTYGIVIRYGAMGPTDSNYYRGNGGVLTHELGHCFNLSHIWGDDNVSCTGSDNVGDTPNEAGRTTGVHTGVLTDSCTKTSPGVMYMNFMDYSNDIVFANFTPGQAARMKANFTSPGGVLLTLSLSNACSPISGITEAENFDFQIFPNPAKDQVFMHTNNISSKGFEIELIDLFGRKIRSEKTILLHSNKNYSFDLKGIGKGIYIINLNIGGQRVSARKLIVE